MLLPQPLDKCRWVYLYCLLEARKLNLSLGRSSYSIYRLDDPMSHAYVLQADGKELYGTGYIYAARGEGKYWGSTAE